MAIARSLLLVLAISLPLTCGSASTLCGVTFRDRSDLVEKLHSEGAEFVREKGVVVAYASTRAPPSLWWLSEPRSAAFPAVACSLKTAGHFGFQRHKTDLDCRGSDPRSCSAFGRNIGRAKF